MPANRSLLCHVQIHRSMYSIITADLGRARAAMDHSGTVDHIGHSKWERCEVCDPAPSSIGVLHPVHLHTVRCLSVIPAFRPIRIDP